MKARNYYQRSRIPIVMLLAAMPLLLTSCGGGGGGGGYVPLGPSAPCWVDATDGDYSSHVFIEWDKVDGADAYSLYRSTASSNSSSDLIADGLMDTCYSDYYTTPGVVYYYWVKAHNGMGSSPYSVSATGYAYSPYSANLYISSLSAPEAGYSTNYGVDDLFSVAVVFGNDGYQSAPDFRIGIYLSEDTVWSSSDIFVGYSDISGLSSEKSAISSGQLPLDPSISPGTYYVMAVADDLGQVAETSESDNGVYYGPIYINKSVSGMVDLASFNFDTDGIHFAYSGSSMYMEFAALNNSDMNCEPYYTLYSSVYLSTNSYISTWDELLSWTSISSMSPLDYVTLYGYFTLPYVSSGLYYLGGFIDDEEVVSEYNESNNTHHWPLVIY